MTDHYAILRLDSGEILYEGDSLFQAAIALNPGTIYGVGKTHEEALAEAKISRLKIRIGLDKAGVDGVSSLAVRYTQTMK